MKSAARAALFLSMLLFLLAVFIAAINLTAWLVSWGYSVSTWLGGAMIFGLAFLLIWFVITDMEEI